MKKKTSKIWKINKTQLENIVKTCDTFSCILKHFGMLNKGGNVNTLKQKLIYEDIDISHIPIGRGSNKNRPKGAKKSILLKEVLTKNSHYRKNSLKKRLIAENLIKYECYECKLRDTWNNKKITLQLDHINGDSLDNRLHNLRLLCPNCHSQTDTFAGRNR